MPEDAVIVLKAIDETGAPMSRVVATARRMQSELRSAMQGVTRGYDDQGSAAERMGRRADGAHRQAIRGIQRHESELQSLVTGYAKAAVSVETVRRAFLGFADLDERMRRLQNQAGASRQQIEALTPALRNLARHTGFSINEIVEGFDTLRENAGLSLADAQKLFPVIAKGAQAAGVSAKDMSTSFAAMMVNAGVQGKEAVAIMNQMVKAGEDYRLEFDKLVQASPRLTEVMGEWGFTGARGNAATLAWLGSLRKVTAGTDEAAEALSKVMELMTNPTVAAKLGHTPDTMADGLKRAQAQGKDTLSVFLDVVAQAEKNGTNLSEMFSKRDIRFIRQLLRDRREIEAWTNDISNSAGKADQSFKNWAEGSKKSINDVINELETLQETFGGFLVQVGAVEALKEATQVFRSLGEFITFASETIENHSIDWAKFLNVTGFRDQFDIMLATWKTRFEQIKAYASGSTTSPGLVMAQTAEAEARFKATGQLPRIKLGDVRESLGVGERLPQSAAGMLWDMLTKKRDLTDEEKKATEQLKKLNDSGDALDQTLKKMKFSMEGTGPGGATVWKASYSPGGGFGRYGAGGGGYGGGPGGFGGGPGGGGFGPGGMPYAGGGRFGGAGLGSMGNMLRDGGPGGWGPGGGRLGGGGAGAGGGGGQSGPGETPGRFANVRTNNPGAQAFSQRAADLFGAEAQRTGTGHSIAKFPSPVHGAASNMDLFMRNYTGIPLGQALHKWSGGSRGAPKGYDPNMIVTPEMMRDPNFAVPLMKAITAGEAPGKYPMDDPQWQQAHQWAMEGGAKGRQALGRSAPSGAPFAGGPRVDQVQAQVADVRRGAIDPRLEEALNAAAEKSGLRVRVTSGGQRMPGAPGATGSHRHDQGRAADFDLLDEKGNKLAIDDPRRVQFLEEMAAAGAGGAGMGYMSDPLKIHGGITGSSGRVGEGLGAYTGSRAEREAIARGVDRMYRERPIWERSQEERAIARGRVEQTIPQAEAGASRTLQGYGHPGAGDTWGRGAQPAPYMGEGGGAMGPFGRGGAPEQGGGPSPFERSSAVDDAMRARQELERPIRVNMDMGGATQFGRASMRREADREVREARFSSTSDIGAA